MGKSLAEKEEKEKRESRLKQAIENDDVHELHNLIGEERELLDRVSKHPFPNTPLHLAAAAGKTQVTIEMAILKPSFARKLNPDGYSPMHLALQHEHYHTVRALMTLDPKLIRVRGRHAITPLHYVACKKGDNELDLLGEFLNACNSSIEDLTSQCETALHVAVKNYNVNAFKVLFGWLMWSNLTKILERKDQEGKTIADIAKSEKLDEITNQLDQYKDLVIAGSFCCQGRSPPILSISQFFSRELTTFVKCANFFGARDEAARNIILVVSTLIAAATYQAVLTPPGGYWQESSSNPMANSPVVAANSSSIAFRKPHQAGDIILSGWRLYLYFICNSMAFFNSIATILATTLPLEATSIVYISIPLLSIAFFISLSIQNPISNAAVVISAGVLFEFSFLAALCLLLYMKAKHGGVQAFNATGRRVPIL